MDTKTTYFPTLECVKKASEALRKVTVLTPLMQSRTYSKKFNANILLKREDLQQVRSYKIRGAYNKISSLSPTELKGGVVCASAGNHAQGVAYACTMLKVKGHIYMPLPTPKQKVEQVKMFGGEFIEIILIGDTYDDAHAEAIKACDNKGANFVHPFDDEKIIEGQATVGLEILEQADGPIDYVFVPIGGGGLASGVSALFQILSPETKIIGVEPEGAPAMKNSIVRNLNTTLSELDSFVDGAAVKRVGELNFKICKDLLYDVITVPEGLVCQTILDLYNKDAIVVEPAGALSLAALTTYSEAIEGKKVVCVVSGSNNDITRTPEIKERALLYAKLKHYFIIKFPQRAGALRQFLMDVLGPNDDITHFEYTKKTNRENGAAIVGLELQSPDDLNELIRRMKDQNYFEDYLNDKPELFQFFV